MPTHPTDPPSPLTTDHSPLTIHHSLLTAHDLVLGIDGGGSGTVALLAPATANPGESSIEIIGRGVGGPSNHQAVGRERAIQSLDEAIHQAFAQAGVARRPVRAACIGLAGADRPDDRAMLAEWSEQCNLAGSVRVENDGSLVLAAGTPDGWGLAVISGTGSFAVARTPDGRTRRCGGWGYLFGDEGSAYATAVAGLQAVARAADGRGAPTSLTPAFLNRLGIDQIELLVPSIYHGMDRTAIAGLADVVTNASAAGDIVAHRIVQHAAAELAMMVAAAARLFRGENVRQTPLALAGGLLLNCPELSDDLVLNLFTHGLTPDPVEQVPEPAIGAVRLARALIA